jgi:2-polyprenyl-6-methoxyphenol hydroxylase-like FAD-dependent oxidoreductase
MEMKLVDTDVLVIGGGPAGLAAAIALRRKGFDVVVADQARPAIDKACGEGLLPDAVTALEALSVTIPADEAMPFRGIRFIEGQLAVESRFPAGPALGIRRTTLHRLLVAHAAAARVSLLWGTRITGLISDGAEAEGASIRARWIIGADGQNSRVRQWAGLSRCTRQRFRYGFRRHFAADPWTKYVEVNWGPNCQVVVTPIAPQELCVSVISDNPRLRLDEALTFFPELARRLRGALSTTPERGAVSTLCTVKDILRGRTVLVGDASGSADAITGDGLGLCFQQALHVADALAANDLARYRAAHRRIARRPRIMSEMMLLMARRPALRRRVVQALAANPHTFARLLAIHIGAASPAELGLGNALAFARELLV